MALLVKLALVYIYFVNFVGSMQHCHVQESTMHRVREFYRTYKQADTSVTDTE